MLIIVIIDAVDWKARPQRSSKASTALSLPIRQLLSYTLAWPADADDDYIDDADDGDENIDHGGDIEDKQNVLLLILQGTGHVKNVCHTVGRQNIHLGHWEGEEMKETMKMFQVSNSYNVTSRQVGPEAVVASCWSFPSTLYLLDRWSIIYGSDSAGRGKCLLNVT